MGNNEELRKTWSLLIDTYEDASNALRGYEDSEDQIHLRKAVETLCEGHSRLQDDEVFWSTLQQLPQEFEKHQKEAEQMLGDYDKLLKAEQQIFKSLEVKDETKIVLIQSMSDSLTSVELELTATRPYRLDTTSAVEYLRNDPKAIGKLRHHSNMLRTAVCHVQEHFSSNEPASLSILYLGASVASKSLLFIGGGAVIVANYLAAQSAGTLALPSMVSGFQMMVNQVPELKETTPSLLSRVWQAIWRPRGN